MPGGPAPATGLPSVGPWQLQRLLGRGAHGEVHLAIDAARGLRVALKLLRLPGPGSPAAGAAGAAGFAGAFAAEVRASGALTHPDIVRVFETGVTAVPESRRLAWIAMEPLAGVDLLRYTQAARRLPEPVALAVAERVAGALAHAHARGVLHRDVKPSNVMVDWAAGRVVLTDFGLARLLEDPTRTATGVVLGSPAYMAPEQLAGAAPHPAADVHALGVMLYELLASRRPHDDAASLGELLRRRADRAPDLREAAPQLPASLAALVARMLAHDPAARPDAAAAARALAAERAALERVPGP